MSDKLRILFVMNSSGGGATQGVIELLKELPGDRYEAYVIVPNKPTPEQYLQFEKVAKEIVVVPMIWWNLKADIPLLWRLLAWVRGSIRTLFHVRSVFSICRRIRIWNIDILYSNSALVIDGAIAARLCGIAHIWHIKETIGQHGRVKFPLPDGLLTKLILGLSARVLVMSRTIGEIFEGHSSLRSASLLRDGVNISAYQGDLGGNDLLQSLGIQEDELLIGMVASLSAIWKQHELFVQTAILLNEKFAHLRFAFFGPIPTEHRNPAYNNPWKYCQRIRRLVNQAGLDARFIWAGYHDDIPQMMDAIDVLVHPCDIEPFGRVAIEAMAAGCPVVGPNRGGIAESVIDGSTGYLVTAHNPEALADAVGHLIEDPKLRQRFGDSGRRHVAAKFSLRQHVIEVAEICEQIVVRDLIEGSAQQSTRGSWLIQRDYWGFWLMSLIVASIALLPTISLSTSGERIDIKNTSGSTLWPSAAACNSENDRSEISVISISAKNSGYLWGVKSILDQKYETATVYLENVYQESENILAASLVAEQAIKPNLTLDLHTDTFSDWSDSRRLSVSRYYLAVAGRCFVNGNHEYAQRNRDIGLLLLPDGEEVALGIGINRRIGQIFYKEDRWDEALPWLWRAAPGGRSPLLILTRILSSRGQYEDALPLYWRALEDYPNSPELFLGGASAASAIGDYEQARRFLEEVKPPSILDVEGYLLLGQVCQKLADISCAESQFKKVLELESKNEGALLGLSELER